LAKSVVPFKRGSQSILLGVGLYYGPSRPKIKQKVVVVSVQLLEIPTLPEKRSTKIHEAGLGFVRVISWIVLSKPGEKRETKQN
jgi:hypothetical protein